MNYNLAEKYTKMEKYCIPIFNISRVIPYNQAQPWGVKWSKAQGSAN
jgi:hypothetical protein